MVDLIRKDGQLVINPLSNREPMELLEECDSDAESSYYGLITTIFKTNACGFFFFLSPFFLV